MLLVIANISKKPNVRKLLQTAVAFGCRGILMVGQRQFRYDPNTASAAAAAAAATTTTLTMTTDRQDQDNTDDDLPPSIRSYITSGQFFLRRFDKWDECVAHLQETNVALVGVEIHPNAVNLEDFVSKDGREVAFLMGNEGTGIHPKHMKDCDGGFIKISQYGSGTASLNVYVAASIVLSHYQYQQRQRGDTPHTSVMTNS